MAVLNPDAEAPLDKRIDFDPTATVQESIALFSAIVSLGMACLGYLCRFGFADNSPVEWVKFVALSWFLLFFASLVRRFVLKRLGRSVWQSWACPAALTLSALLLAADVGAVWGFAAKRGVNQTLLGWCSSSLLLISGGIGCGLGFWTVLRMVRLRDVAALLVFAALFSVYGIAASAGTGYQNPLFVEGLTINYGHIDELFNASLANMFRTYSVSSTGLDGVPFVPYHFGSNWLFAQLCNLLDVRVIDFYSRGYRVVFLPFGVYCLGVFASSLMQQPHAVATDERLAGNSSVRVVPLFWLIILTGYVSFMPHPPFLTPIYAWSSIIISETYAVGVAVSLLALAWAWSFFQTIRVRQNLWSWDILVAAILGAGLMAAITLLKISQGFILGALATYFLVRLRWYRSPVFWLLYLAIAAGSISVLKFVTPGFQEAHGFMLFGFVRTCVERQWWPYFWLFYYAWLWVVSTIRLRQERVRTFGDLLQAFRQRRLLDVEFLFVAAVAGAIPAMLFVPYSSAQYFAEYQQWLAMGVLLSMVARWSGRRAADSHETPADRLVWTRWKQVTVGRVFLVAVVVTVAWMDVSNTLELAARLVHDDAVSRGHAGGGTGLSTALAHGRLGEASRILHQTAAEAEGRFKGDKNIVGILRDLDRMPLSEKRTTILFIPKSNRQFWDLLRGSRWPLDGPLVAPALSGLAMIDGVCVPPQQLTVWAGFGYQVYSRPKPSDRQPPLPGYLPDLRKRCAAMGFKQLIVIDQAPDGHSRSETYDCAGPSTTP